MKNKIIPTFSLNHISIAKRIMLLFIVPITILMIVGVLATQALNKNERNLLDLQIRAENINFESKFVEQVHNEYQQTLLGVHNGILTWKEGKIELAKAITHFTKLTTDYNERFNQGIKEDNLEINVVLKAIENFKIALTEGKRLIAAENHAWLELFIINDMDLLLYPLFNALTKQENADILSAKNNFEHAKESTHNALMIAFFTITFGLFLTAVLGYFIYRSIIHPTRNLSTTVQKLVAGNFQVRAEVHGNDELAQLSKAFNQLLDDRMSTLNRIDQEHQQLNHSVIGLLQVVSQLSDRDLTVRATVTEDATGPLADAINLLSEETSDVLKQVQTVAEAVEKNSKELNQHTLSVNEIAGVEQREAKQTAQELSNIVQQLDNIAQAAQQMNKSAEETASSTNAATQSVSFSLESMYDIRERTQETGKRIKRLGERSQEITHIVEIINTIAERTTVLALNASMQAASAGEAGRGFSVVAEEIQRLAENSRESTSQIAALVRNIQLETNETIRTMDRTIEQVVAGSKLAESAGEQMQQAQKATSSLVLKVGQISNASQQQAEISKTLKSRAKHIVDATLATGERLQLQSILTEKMVKYTRNLVQSVKVFRLQV